MAKKKAKKTSLLQFNLPHLLYLFILLTIILGGLFLKYGNAAFAAASFYLRRANVGEEVRRGGPLSFNVHVLGQNAGESLSTGIEFDKRKLRLDSIEPGELGEVSWERIGDTGDKTRIVIRNSQVSSGDDNKIFARVNFTIIDETDEVDPQGRGFTELCTIFEPDEETPTSPQTNPTSIPTTGENTPIPTQVNEPTPTPIASGDLDMSKLCIPLEVHGSPADKMDFIMIPMNYSDYSRFVEQAQLAIQRMNETNLSGYRNEVLNKMNWYLLNTNHEHIPAEFRGRAITQNEQQAFMNAVHGLCPHDRYIYFVDEEWLRTTDGAIIGGSAYLYEGFQFAARSVYDPTSNVFAHEWGHAAAGLIDEYDAGKWFEGGDSTTGFNCTRVPNEPNQDPCPYGDCRGDVNSDTYKTACPVWDCNKRECNDLQRSLFANAGCYQRCSSQNGYRAAAISIMDAVIPEAGEDITRFNGPSLYSIIEYTFGRYK